MTYLTKEDLANAAEEILKQRESEPQECEVPSELQEKVLAALEKGTQDRLAAEETVSKGHGSHKARKVILSLVAAVLLISIVTVSATAFFNPIQKLMEVFNIRDFGEGSDITYSENYGEVGWLNGTYKFVPKGFELETNDVDDIHQWMVYRNAKGDELVSSTMKVEGSISTLNTEDTELEEIRIGNAYGQYLRDKNDYQEIQWVTGKYVNSLSVENMAASKADLIKMAKSRVQAK